jgi:UDP-glucuronate 4-epimerase
MTRKSKILVTGGAGFIGSHLVEALLRAGRQVVIVDSLDDFYSPARKRTNLAEIAGVGEASFHQVDIRDLAALEAVFRQERPEVMIHAAARAGVRPSIELPKLYEEVNVAGTVNLLTLAQTFGVRKFVFVSSSSVYGATARVPFIEDHLEMRPVSPYAATKLAGELICYTYAHLYHLPVVCLRLFTVYGPRQRPDLAIHKFTALLEAGKPIPIFGDGGSSRDYTYVEDTVAGILASLDYDAEFEVFNLGNSHPVRLLDLVKELEKATGKRATLEFLPPQPGDVEITWADVTKARQLLGYDPKTPLGIGLKRFVAWYRRAK